MIRNRQHSQVNWGVFLPSFSASAPIDVAALRRLAVTAEERGLEYAFVGDHLIWNTGILAPLPTLAHLAAVTERIKLGPGVYLLPLRPPVIAAKDVITLDLLSGGRLVMGVGAGGENPDEYRAAGIEPGDRGARMNEGIAALRALLEGEGNEIEGRFVNVPALTLEPRPERPVPIWVGGRADAVVDRAAQLGDGWFPVWISAERYATARERVLEQRREDGFAFALNIFVSIAETRDEAKVTVMSHMQNAYALPFERFERYVAYGPPEDIRAKVRPYLDAGVTDVVFNLVGPAPEEQLDLLTREVLGSADPAFMLPRSAEAAAPERP